MLAVLVDRVDKEHLLGRSEILLISLVPPGVEFDYMLARNEFVSRTPPS